MEQNKKPVRFELIDPREGEYGTKYSFEKQADMEAKADELGASRFQGITADNAVMQYRKQDGAWQQYDPQAEQAQAEARRLAEQLSQRIQREHATDPNPAAMSAELRNAIAEMGGDPASDLERRAALGIEGRGIAYKNAAAGHPGPEVLAPEVARQWAELDAREFRKIQDQQRQEDAALAMADAARANAAYKAALAERAPDIAAVVAAHAAEDDAKIAAKEGRKAADAQAMGLAVAGRDADAFEVLHRDAPAPAAPTPAKTPAEALQAIQDRALDLQGERIDIEDVAPDVAARLARDDQADYARLGAAEKAVAADLIVDNFRNRAYSAEFARRDPEAAQAVVRVASQHFDLGERTASMKDSELEAMIAANEKAEGIPMKSMPGKVMVYNDRPGMAGAEIVNEDGSRISFGGKEAIEKYAAENKLAPEDVATLKALDARADEFRTPPAMTIDPAALERVAAVRAADRAAVEKQLGLNAIEPGSEAEATRQAGLAKAKAAPEEGRAGAGKPGGNQVESDEIFTASQDIKPLVPADIEKQYIRIGDKFYHSKNTDLVAFEDKGNKLETKSNSEAIAESMVRIAEARGWDEIKVTGTETFRREAWLEAAVRGMHVKGYTPTEQDHAALAARLRESGSNAVEKDNPRFRARENAGQPAGEAREADAKRTDAQPAPAAAAQAAEDREDARIRGAVGVLLAHGAAKYLHDEKNSDSYYVTTRDPQGKEKTSWGVDLERAVAESGAKVGDQVFIANEGQKPVTIMVPKHDKAGNVVGHEEKETHRNAWNVQRAEAFAKDAAEAVKQHPELAGAAAAAAAIDKQAAADGLNPQQRAIVAARVRHNIVNSIERGDIPEVKVRDELVVQRERQSSAGQAQEYAR